MRRLWLVAGLLIAGCATPQAGAEAPTAKLTIRAVGATMEFRTIGLVNGFTLADGQSRTFRRLTPGTYVVVQAPPVGVWTEIEPDHYEVTGGMQITCSDGVSSNQYDLVAGESLTCTFTAS